MDFNEAWRLYIDLKGQFDQGRISGDDFERRVNGISVTDSTGKLWQIGVKTGKWYRYNGQNWVEDVPAGAASVAGLPSPIPASPPSVAPESPARSFNWLWLGGGLAVLALLGCVALVVVLFVFNQPPTQPESGPAASVTLQPATVQPFNTRPTMMPTQPAVTSPGGGNQAGPGFDPNSVFVDDFSNPASGWDRQTDNDGTTDYANGKYRILVEKSNLLIWATAHKNFNGDVGIEVDATKAGGPDDNEFGVICRYQDANNFYRFLISSDGYAVISKKKDGQKSDLSADKMQSSDAIHQGAATNHLRATCIGNSLSLLVNGQEVASASDGSIMSGDVGLLAGTFDNAGVDILFDNFSASAR